MKKVSGKGTRYFHQAVTLVGREKLLEEIKSTVIKFCGAKARILNWNLPLEWAVKNVIISTLNPKREIDQSYELEEVLTQEEINQFKEAMN